MEWYRLHRRDLPMRADDVSPWGTLVFEVMSQQTPIPRVQPIWERWMSLWPTPADLTKASPAEVLVEWSHLGYPSRALRLRDCALSITRDFGGVLPSSYEALLDLPGIGPYTASAIASFQFHQRIPVLDTNIRRVFARICDGVEFARRCAPSRSEFTAAMEWLPEDGAVECGDHGVRSACVHPTLPQVPGVPTAHKLRLGRGWFPTRRGPASGSGVERNGPAGSRASDGGFACFSLGNFD